MSFILCEEKKGTNLLMLSLYIYNLIYTSNCDKMLINFKNIMMIEYEMINLGLMKYFLYIKVRQNKGEMFIPRKI